MRLSSNRALLVALGLGISTLAAWLSIRQVDLGRVRESLETAHWAWLVPSLVLTYVVLWLRAVRWRFLFADPGSVTTWQSAVAVNIGLAFNNILPWRAGEIPRIFALRRVTGLSAFGIGATVVVERVLDVFVLALLGLALWPFLPDRDWIHALEYVCVGIVAGVVTLVALLVATRERLGRLAPRAARLLPFVSEPRMTTVLASIGAGGRVLLHPRRLLLSVALSVAVWAVTGLSVLALYPAFDLDIRSSSSLLILVTTSFALTVPSTSGALGVYEAAVRTALVAYGVPASQALSFALALHAVNFFPVIATGLAAMWMAGSRHAERVGLAIVPQASSPAR